MSAYRRVIVRTDSPDGTHAYIAWHPEFDIVFEDGYCFHRCMTQGDTVEQAAAFLAEACEMSVEHLREHSLPVPEPSPLNDKIWTIDLSLF